MFVEIGWIAIGAFWIWAIRYLSDDYSPWKSISESLIFKAKVLISLVMLIILTIACFHFMSITEFIMEAASYPDVNCRKMNFLPQCNEVARTFHVIALFCLTAWNMLFGPFFVIIAAWKPKWIRN